MPSASPYPATPSAIVRGFWRHRQLILATTQRNILGRYRGSALGLLWSFFNPLAMLAAYTFVFGTIFNARWQASASQGHGEFALVLFAGIREKFETARIPGSYQGTAIGLITAGLMALAFLGFSGMV